MQSKHNVPTNLWSSSSRWRQLFYPRTFSPEHSQFHVLTYADACLQNKRSLSLSLSHSSLSLNLCSHRLGSRSRLSHRSLSRCLSGSSSRPSSVELSLVSISLSSLHTRSFPRTHRVWLIPWALSLHNSGLTHCSGGLMHPSHLMDEQKSSLTLLPHFLWLYQSV